MSALRTRLAVPIALTSIVAAIVVDLLILSELRRQFQADLQQTVERQTSLLSSIPLKAGEGIQLRGVAILAILPDGSNRLPIEPWSPSAWAVIDDDGRVPPASEFLEVPAVGARLDSTPEAWQGIVLPEEHAAIIVSTHSAAQAYSEIRVRLILTTSATVLALFIVSWVVGSRLGHKIRRMTRRITILADDDASALARARDVDEMESFSNELEFAHATLNKTKDNIERLQKMRSEFLANVSHEVRTPLFALKGYLETLLDGGIDDPSVSRSFLEKAQKHAQRLDVLLSDLIEISRIETGDMKMSFRYFQLDELLEAAYETHSEAAKAKGQELILQSIDREVLGDRERLMQVLSNLLSNAIAYSPEGARIALSAKEGPKSVTITVEDDGPGIAPEHRSRVFERFYRVDPGRSREAGGSGLGLAIVKHIVEAHGSQIMLHNDLSRGSAFSFELKKGS